jgi:hypothetical protein
LAYSSVCKIYTRKSTLPGDYSCENTTKKYTSERAKRKKKKRQGEKDALIGVLSDWAGLGRAGIGLGLVWTGLLVCSFDTDITYPAGAAGGPAISKETEKQTQKFLRKRRGKQASIEL